MSNEYKLPFSDKPLVTCFHNMAFPLGVIEGNANNLDLDITPWVISKFLNPIFVETPEKITYDICLVDKWGIDEGILFYQFINMFKRIYDNLNFDIAEYLSKMIREGCYVIGTYNEKYIPGKADYQNGDFMHDYILYGVDEERKVFYSAGYLKDRKYQSYEISFSDFIKSIYNTPGDRIQFGFRTYNNEYQYCFNKERIVQELTDYLNSTTYHGLKENAFYGMEANRKLKEYFLSTVHKNGNSRLDLRYTRAYMEHKYFMNLCIEYLIDNNLVDATKINFKKAKELYQDAVRIHILGIKMEISKNYKIIDKIADLFDKIQEEESQMIRYVIEAMGDK